MADDGRRDFAMDIFDGPIHRFAAPASRIAVAQFDRFELAGRCAGRNQAAAARAVFEPHFRFQSGHAARVEDLIGGNADDFHASRLGVSNPSKPILDHRGQFLRRSEDCRLGKSQHLLPLCLRKILDRRLAIHAGQAAASAAIGSRDRNIRHRRQIRPRAVIRLDRRFDRVVQPLAMRRSMIQRFQTDNDSAKTPDQKPDRRTRPLRSR